MCHSCSIAMDVNPQLRPGLDALDWWLADHHYSHHARERIRRHVAATGTLAGCMNLESEDEAGAEATFIASLPALSTDSPAWERPDAFLDAEMLADGTHPMPFGANVLDAPEDDIDGPDAIDDPAFYGPTRVAALNRPRVAIEDIEPGDMSLDDLDAAYAEAMVKLSLSPALPPIAGGSPRADADAGLDGFPSLKTRDDVRRDAAEIREWFATHPGE